VAPLQTRAEVWVARPCAPSRCCTAGQSIYIKSPDNSGIDGMVACSAVIEL
jgi:hypothetical protein